MKVICKNDKVTTNGLTIGKEYEVIYKYNSGNDLYRIVDDNGDIKGYSVDFFVERTKKIITNF